METNHHITVRYGIKGEDTAGIRACLVKQAPVEAELGQTDSFPPSEHSDGAVPIIVPIESIELRRIEKELDKHGDFKERSFPQYKPHATIAYVKPEAATKYEGDQTAMDKTFTVTHISITGRNGESQSVQLKGKTDALQKPEASSVLQPKPEEAGSPGGERSGVEPGKQGAEAAGEGKPEAPLEQPKEEVKPKPSFYKPKVPQIAALPGSTPLGARVPPVEDARKQKVVPTGPFEVRDTQTGTHPRLDNLRRQRLPMGHI